MIENEAIRKHKKTITLETELIVRNST
jgi:hypothetical protein